MHVLMYGYAYIHVWSVNWYAIGSSESKTYSAPSHDLNRAELMSIVVKEQILMEFQNQNEKSSFMNVH